MAAVLTNLIIFEMNANFNLLNTCSLNDAEMSCIKGGDSIIDTIETKGRSGNGECVADVGNLYDDGTPYGRYESKETSRRGYNHCTIIFNNSSKISCNDCGKIKTQQFFVNTKGICLASSYNSCLYKKISIDIEGNIKNCPSCSKSFGNMRSTTLEQALSYPDFKALWGVTKDQVDVCKDCEFRRICPDCRVFIKDPANPYSQPAKCTYNPYIARWQGEEGYVPVEECGTYTRKTGFVPDTKLIATLNHEIWNK